MCAQAQVRIHAPFSHLRIQVLKCMYVCVWSSFFGCFSLLLRNWKGISQTLSKTSWRAVSRNPLMRSGLHIHVTLLSILGCLKITLFQRPSASELLRHPFLQTASKTDRWQDFVRQKVQLMRQLQRELVGATGPASEAGQLTMVVVDDDDDDIFHTFLLYLILLSISLC